MVIKEKNKCLYCKSKCKNIFCNNKCHSNYKYEEYIKRWKLGLEIGNDKSYHISGHIRRYMLEIKNYQCEKCGWNKINTFTQRPPLTISHIDGDWQNTTEHNLEVLCPNCHSLTESYCALNKGRGRPRYAHLK